jgi:hypothetical protein
VKNPWFDRAKVFLWLPFAIPYFCVAKIMRVQPLFQPYIHSFAERLANIKETDLSDSPYCQRYFRQLQAHRSYYLEIYAAVLQQVLNHTNVAREHLTLLETGAGNGWLALFAKHCGFGTVLVHDLDPVFLAAAMKLSHSVQLTVIAMPTTEISEWPLALRNQQIDAIVGTDMIEHVYHLPSFFQSLAQLQPAKVFVFTTGSNPENPWKVHRLKKLQRRDEWIGGSPDDSALFGHEPHASFRQIRKDIISAEAPNIGEKELAILVKATRGQKQSDIIKSVALFQKNGQLPLPASGHNTCHPVTGSHTERILPLADYKAICQEAGFQVKISSGFYDTDKKGLKKHISNLLNRLLTIFGTRIAPFIFLTGTKK